MECLCTCCSSRAAVAFQHKPAAIDNWLVCFGYTCHARSSPCAAQCPELCQQLYYSVWQQRHCWCVAAAALCVEAATRHGLQGGLVLLRRILQHSMRCSSCVVLCTRAVPFACGIRFGLQIGSDDGRKGGVAGYLLYGRAHRQRVPCFSCQGRVRAGQFQLGCRFGADTRQSAYAGTVSSGCVWFSRAFSATGKLASVAMIELQLLGA